MCLDELLDIQWGNRRRGGWVQRAEIDRALQKYHSHEALPNNFDMLEYGVWHQSASASDAADLWSVVQVLCLMYSKKNRFDPIPEKGFWLKLQDDCRLSSSRLRSKTIMNHPEFKRSQVDAR